MLHKGFIFILLLSSLQASGKTLEMVHENLGRVSISPYTGQDGNTGTGKGASVIQGKDPALSEVFPFNEQVRVQVRIVPASEMKGLRLSYFNVCMPHHNHCMKLQPRIDPVKGQENLWIVSGIKLHMDGNWQVTLKFSRPGGSEIEINEKIFVSMPGAAGSSKPTTTKPVHKK